MPIACFAGLALDPSKLLLSVLSLSLALVFLFLLHRPLSNTSRISLLYAHLASLFFPAVLLTTQTTCGLLCISLCSNPTSLLPLVLLSLPTTLLLSFLSGSLLLPLLFLRTHKKISSGWLVRFVRSSSVRLSIRPPSLFLIDKASPVAFSFRHLRSAVFLSVGLCDILSRKEVEAVLLHELAHLKRSTSALRLSLVLFRFSPLSLLIRFHHLNHNEEQEADRLAAAIQHTSVYLSSARKKIQAYERRETQET